MKPVTGIMAATEDGVVGCSGGNGLPWEYPEELEHYRRTTAGAIIIMGRRTFEQMPDHALKTRSPIVLSRSWAACAAGPVARTPEEAVALAQAIEGPQKIFMIGGARTAEAFLKRRLVDAFILSTIITPHDGDVRMDIDHFKNWNRHRTGEGTGFTIDQLLPKF